MENFGNKHPHRPSTAVNWTEHSMLPDAIVQRAAEQDTRLR